MSLALSYLNRDSKAFTLIEVLIAITIGSMVIGIVAMAFSLSVRNWERAKSSDSPYTSSEELINFMEKQLLHIFKKTVQLGEENKLFFSGEKNKLIFITDYSPLGISGNCKVVVKYQYDKNDKKLYYSQIIYSKSPNLLDQIRSFITLKPEDLSQYPFVTSTAISINNFSITYKSKDGTSFQDAWTDIKSLPSYITVKAQPTEEDKPLVRLIYLNLFEVLDQLQAAKGDTSGV